MTKNSEKKIKVRAKRSKNEALVEDLGVAGHLEGDPNEIPEREDDMEIEKPLEGDPVEIGEGEKQLEDAPVGDGAKEEPLEGAPVEIGEVDVPMENAPVIIPEGRKRPLPKYTELYLQEYAETENKKTQLYAKDKTRGEYYKRNADNTEEVYAKRMKGSKMVNYYAQTANLEEFVPKKEVEGKWVDQGYMRDEDNKEIYPFSNQDQYDLLNADSKGDPILARDERGIPYYPKFVDPITKDEIQYMPSNSRNKYVVLYDRKRNQRYPWNYTQKKYVYPQHGENGNEFYMYNRDAKFYYLANDGVEEYAKELQTVIDENGNEVQQMLPVFIKDANGKPIYARNINEKKEIYPQKPNGAEFYKQIGLVEKPALANVEDEESEYYARDENKTEIYPKEYINPNV